MATKKSCLLIPFLLCISNLSFAAERPSNAELIKSLKQSNISDTLRNAINLVEKRTNQLRTSWMPLLYRIAGTIFGITAGVSTIDSILVATNAPQEVKDTLYRYAYADRSPLRATNYLLDKPMPFISKALNSILSTAQEKELIGPTGFGIGETIISNGESILAAGIAAWFFKKANSYENAAKKLEADLLNNIE